MSKLAIGAADDVNPLLTLNRNQSPDFVIKAAGDEDRQAIIKLMSNTYTGDMEARFAWLYRANPHGRALTWLAIERASGEVVGCTSMFPRKVIVKGCERRGSIGGDCYIEPRARRRGLATALHLASFAEMRESGVEFMYGPPTLNNLGALIKAGSHDVTGYRRWVRPLSRRGAYRAACARAPTTLKARVVDWPLRIFDRVTRIDTTGYTLEPVHQFGAAFDGLLHRAAETHGVVCVRDAAYLNWRYRSSPHHRQTPMAVKRGNEVVGFVALEQVGERAAIADLFAENNAKQIDAILQLAIESATDAGCSSLEINVTEHGAIARRLHRHGFIGRDERRFQVAAASDDPQRRTLLDPAAWHFTENDQDMDTVFAQG